MQHAPTLTYAVCRTHSSLQHLLRWMATFSTPQRRRWPACTVGTPGRCKHPQRKQCPKPRTDHLLHMSMDGERAAASPHTTQAQICDVVTAKVPVSSLPHMGYKHVPSHADRSRPDEVLQCKPSLHQLAAHAPSLSPLQSTSTGKSTDPHFTDQRNRHAPSCYLPPPSGQPACHTST